MSGEGVVNAIGNGSSGAVVRSAAGPEPRERVSGRTGRTVADADCPRPEANGRHVGDEPALTGVGHCRRAKVANPNGHRRTPEGEYGQWLFPPGPADADGWREYIAAGGPEPVVLGGSHGDAERLDRIHAAGNGVVPLVAATAFIRLATRALR